MSRSADLWALVGGVAASAALIPRQPIAFGVLTTVIATKWLQLASSPDDTDEPPQDAPPGV
jgi:hypothetical protein